MSAQEMKRQKIKTLAWRLLISGVLIGLATFAIGTAAGFISNVVGLKIVLFGAVLALAVVAISGLCLLVSFLAGR
jgi:hypothetical protein